jgi:hypothetical protein
MMRSGNIAVLTYEDITEGLLGDHRILDLPAGCTRLMIIQDAVDELNEALGFTNADDEEDRDYDTADRYGD